MPRINPAWISALTDLANSAGGLRFVPEPPEPVHPPAGALAGDRRPAPFPASGSAAGVGGVRVERRRGAERDQRLIRRDRDPREAERSQQPGALAVAG